jgi:predicted O-linked N-acetylglucosamine transferase (SPINDLY family)
MSRIAQKVEEAQALVAAGRPADALALLQRVAGARTRDPMLLSALCFAASSAQELAKAEFYAKQLVDLMPQHSDAYANLALIQGRLSKRAEACKTYAKALALDPFNDNVRTGFANLLLEAGEPTSALAICAAAPHKLSHEQLTLTHAGCLAALARCEEAVTLLDAGLEKFPNPFTRSQLAVLRCAMLQNVAAATPALVADAHALVGQTITETLGPVATPLSPAHDPDKRPLRLAILSPDLRTHSVAFFAEPILRHLDKSRFELHALSNHPVEDATSARLRALCASWTPVHQLPDAALIEHLRQQRFDILLDLTGLAGHHRLRVLAARVAPLQITYCGYPDTTGVPNVDFRIVDHHTDPTTPMGGLSFDQRCAERLYRLPDCFLCYAPPAEAPEPSFESAPDVSSTHPIVFASFNTARKISPQCAALWARVLEAVPGSALLLKSKEFAEKGMIDRVRSMFEAAASPQSNLIHRVHVVASVPCLADHLAMYRKVHIALDTFPYHGTTTTCEAMWMGVPVITLAGDRHVSRVGASLLHQAGLDDLITTSDQAFVAAAARLAADRARMIALRDPATGLRATLRASPLCDQPSMGRRFGDALLDMWRTTCQSATMHA